MGVQWFVEQAQRVYGPFDAARLKKLAAARKISADSRVGQSRTGPWVRAAQVRGLFPAQPAAQAGRSESSSGTSSDHGTPAHDERRIWLYKSGDEVRGPVSESEIERLVADGRIARTTLVLRVGQTHWETAFTAGLFLDAPAQESVAGAGEVSRAGAADDVEDVLWAGRPAHAADTVFYTLCTIGAPLLLPAWWGLRRYVATDATQYQVTTRRVRIRTGLFARERTDVPLARIRDARLTRPWRLRGTGFCNIELLGDESSTPLAVLSAIPVDESALVISLCEAGADHQIGVHAAQKIVAAAARQERARMQAEMRSHADEIRRLKDELASERKRLQEERASERRDRVSESFAPWGDLDDDIGLPTEDAGTPGVPGFGAGTPRPPSGGRPASSAASAALWNVFCRGALSFVPVPAPVTVRRTPPSRLTAAATIFGRRRKRTVRVKGHWRGGKWVAEHYREIG